MRQIIFFLLVIFSFTATSCQGKIGDPENRRNADGSQYFRNDLLYGRVIKPDQIETGVSYNETVFIDYNLEDGVGIVDVKPTPGLNTGEVNRDYTWLPFEVAVGRTVYQDGRVIIDYQIMRVIVNKYNLIDYKYSNESWLIDISERPLGGQSYDRNTGKIQPNFFYARQGR